MAVTAGVMLLLNRLLKIDENSQSENKI
jgi:hypothetical protein